MAHTRRMFGGVAAKFHLYRVVPEGHPAFVFYDFGPTVAAQMVLTSLNLPENYPVVVTKLEPPQSLLRPAVVVRAPDPKVPLGRKGWPYRPRGFT